MYNEKNVTLKRTIKDINQSYLDKRESVFQLLSLNKCLIISVEDQDIIFVSKGIVYMIHLKKNSTNISSRLQHKMDAYINHGIIAKAVYNVFELEAILQKTEAV
jgi:hypothetical protein